MEQGPASSPRPKVTDHIQEWIVIDGTTGRRVSGLGSVWRAIVQHLTQGAAKRGKFLVKIYPPVGRYGLQNGGFKLAIQPVHFQAVAKVCRAEIRANKRKRFGGRVRVKATNRRARRAACTSLHKAGLVARENTEQTQNE